MYIETSEYRKGDSTYIQSPLVTRNKKTCLQFYYHMNGTTMGSLAVKIKRPNGIELVWSLAGDQVRQPIFSIVGQHYLLFSKLSNLKLNTIHINRVSVGD